MVEWICKKCENYNKKAFGKKICRACGHPHGVPVPKQEPEEPPRPPEPSEKELLARVLNNQAVIYEKVNSIYDALPSEWDEKQGVELPKIPQKGKKK